MENGKKPAFPLGQAENFRWSDGVDLGLTKREYFAGLAMQEVFSYALKNELPNGLFQTAAIDAIKMADALLAELDKPETE